MNNYISAQILRIKNKELIVNKLTNFTNVSGATSHTTDIIVTTLPANGVTIDIFEIGKKYKVTILGETNAEISINTANLLTSPTIRQEKLSGFGSITFIADYKYLYLRHATSGTSTLSKISVVKII